MMRWIAGIVATVLSGVLIFWLTEGLQGLAEKSGDGQQLERYEPPPELSRSPSNADNEWIELVRSESQLIDMWLTKYEDDSGGLMVTVRRQKVALGEALTIAKRALDASQNASVSAKYKAVKRDFEEAMRDILRASEDISALRFFLIDSYKIRMKKVRVSLSL